MARERGGEDVVGWVVERWESDGLLSVLLLLVALALGCVCRELNGRQKTYRNRVLVAAQTSHPLGLLILDIPDAHQLIPSSSDNVLPILASGHTQNLSTVPIRRSGGFGPRKLRLAERRPDAVERRKGVAVHRPFLRRHEERGGGK